MDGESFDQLSVVVHRLRNTATRRSALGLLFGGSLAAAGTLLGEDASARKNRNRKNNNCRGFGAKCSRNSDCCFSKCRNGRCWYGGSGGGGGNKNCGGRKCQAGWDCCKTSGVSICVPDNYPTCCGGNSYVPGYRCCGGFGGACPSNGSCCGGFNQCCQYPNNKCCNRGGVHTCIPSGWDCDDFFRQEDSNFGIESASRIPSSAPIPVDESDWISIEVE